MFARLPFFFRRYIMQKAISKYWPVFVLPTLLAFIIGFIWPFIWGIYLSFQRFTTVSKTTFVGIQNYISVFQDSTFLHAFGFTAVFTVVSTVLINVCAFAIALVLTRGIKGTNLFRTVYFFPVVISATAIGLLFKLFYNYNGGMLNQILEKFGAEPVNWLSPKLAFAMVCIPTLWSYIGFYFVILLTGLSDISDDIYEAASIDGCNRFKQVFYITLPMMKPVFFTSVTLAVTGALKVFDLPWVMVPNGAPQGLTHFLGTYMYQQTFGLNDYDYGSTLAVLIVVLGIVVSKGVGFLTMDSDEREEKKLERQRKKAAKKGVA